MNLEEIKALSYWDLNILIATKLKTIREKHNWDWHDDGRYQLCSLCKCYSSWREDAPIGPCPSNDYCDDLNICYQMEETLTDEQRIIMDKHLALICQNSFHSTARERCEALLLTVEPIPVL